MTFKLFPFILFLHCLLLELCNGATFSGCIANERNALLNFKKNLIDEHNRLASWEREDCCNWEGVSCNNVTGHVVMLDLRNPYNYFEYGDVDHLEEWSLSFAEEYEDNFKERSLRGQLSPSLLGLKQLKYLDLSMNYFDGPIPKFVGSLHNLRYLNLSHAHFNGLIPPHLGNLTKLKYLDISGWFEYGTDFNVSHDVRWISGLISLKRLAIKNTKFENFKNWMEALNVLPNIAEIQLSYCDISAFPVSLPYMNFTKLSYLDLSYNFIDLKSIPLWVLNIKSLAHIDLCGNNFRSIPDAFKNLTSLEYVGLSQNFFSGAGLQALKSLCKMRTLYIQNAMVDGDINWFREIFSGCVKDSIENLDLSEGEFNDNMINGPLPDWFGELHNLKTLNLMGNLLSGCIPDWFGELHNLKTLDLSFNSLSGCIPESLGRLAALQELILSGNNLNGTVPKSIGQLSNLVRLDLYSNKLEGVISEVHFASLTKLKELRLYSNNLILNVSGDWVPPFKLNIINIGSCMLGPKFPAWLQTQANILDLDLSGSGIVDTLPDWFWDVFATTHHVSLDISNNGITGNLPSFLKSQFYNFVLTSNFLSGSLPQSFKLAENVDITNNSFSGSIQSIIDNTGRLPNIDLSRNKFSGEIPSSICLTGATYVDLSRNLFTGELPNCWNPDIVSQSSLKFGEFFDFSRNNLTGNIPHTLGTLISLDVLHLGYNNFSGNIPTTLRNCTQLTVLDLGMNKLNGTIPTWLGENLAYLAALVLRSNDFTGNVPSNLSKLRYLQILDLGNNTLSGRIPRSFGNFTVMMDINFTSQWHYAFFLPNHYHGQLQLNTKGRNFLYDELLTEITIIDLSCNNLSGHMPKELGNLQGLIYLNISRNHLVGSIPDEIGLMHSLESLDLSRNRLSNNIPLSMSKLTVLNFLNLSYNNLTGSIPSGNQLQTFTNESYLGNPELCGFPVTQSCASNKTTNDEESVNEETESDYWYLSIAYGFVLGFWIVLGTFYVKKKWRDAYFGYVDYSYNAINVVIAVSINRFKRKIGNETASG